MGARARPTGGNSRRCGRRTPEEMSTPHTCYTAVFTVSVSDSSSYGGWESVWAIVFDRGSITTQRDAIGPERIRQDDLAPGLHIGPRHLFHAFGMREIPIGAPIACGRPSSPKVGSMLRDAQLGLSRLKSC
jgi:hypothetical protein